VTREEAITVLKALSDNPLFSNLHKTAFSIAIHDIKAHHDWDINNLILKNKDNYEPLEQEPILDKIRAQFKSHLRGVEITLEVLVENDPLRPKFEGAKETLEECLEIIDKAETEDT
jgi:hypothetical protein